EACRQAQAWRDLGLPEIKMSVNLAGQQLMHQRVIDMVASALRASGLPATCLELEVTESYLIRQTELIVPKIEKMKAMGVGFSMDDFGTGYSSFSYLKALPVDRLKIDKSFVQDLDSNRGDKSIILAILALCKGLELDVVAEGVDSQAQKDFLIEHGCTTIQGYLYSKPLDADETQQFLQERAHTAI
ncbi:MAG: EAL domain-containing protein, partial [Pontibacterium sp.]